MPDYILNIDQLFKCWQNNQIQVSFDGTEEELRDAIEKNGGDLSDFDPEYIETEFICETEELMTQNQNGGDPVYEIHSLEAA